MLSFFLNQTLWHNSAFLFFSWFCFQTPKRSRYRLRCAPSAVAWKRWIIRAMICLHSSCVIWSSVQTAVLAQPQWIYEEQTFTRCANLRRFQDGCMFNRIDPSTPIRVSLLAGSAQPLYSQFSAWSYFYSSLLYWKLYTFLFIDLFWRVV